MAAPTDIAVSVDKLEKRFGAFTAVNKISFDVKRGEIFGFLGPNGAGKSTTIRMLCGILTPTSGAGTVGGFDIMRQQEEIKAYAEAFRDNGLPPAEAAKIILDGVREERWRILVGPDAVALDKAVRAHPEEAYEHGMADLVARAMAGG